MKYILSVLKQITYNAIRELQIILHDPGAILILVLALFIYPVIYSFAYKNEVLKEAPIAVVDLDNTSASRSLKRMVDATEQVQLVSSLGSLAEAQELFYNGDVNGVVVIPHGFEKDLMANRQTTVAVYADAGYVLVYKQIYSGLLYAARTLGGGVEVKRLVAGGKTFEQALDKQSPLQVQTIQLFNPSAGYGSFLMPAMIVLIIQQTLLIGIGLVGGTFKERKKYKAFNLITHKRGGAFSMVIGKTFAYLLISLFNAFVALLIIYNWFEFPDKSGFIESFHILIPFFLSTIFLGLTFSVWFKRRINSLLFLVFLSPIVLFLSGLSWPVQAMPETLQNISQIFPSTHAIPAYIKLRIQGSSPDSYMNEWWKLIALSIIYFICAVASYHIAFQQYKKKYIS